MKKLKENNFKRQEFKFTLDKKSFLSLVKDKKLRKILVINGFYDKKNIIPSIVNDIFNNCKNVELNIISDLFNYRRKYSYNMDYDFNESLYK